MGPKPRDTDEGFFLKELALSLKILENFRFLAASKSKWSEEKKQSADSNSQQQKKLINKKDSKVSFF